MKALVLEEYHKLVYKDVPEPQRGENDVLVRVKACGICGSDVHGMDGSTGRRIPPIIMGHEASGVIDKIGKNVSGWKTGDRVTFDSTIYDQNDWFSKRGDYNFSDHREVLGVSCNEYRRDGAFAEFVCVPQHILHLLPGNVSYDQAALVEPAAVALHAVRLTQVSEDDTIMIIGAGIIGLFLVQMLRASGYVRIISIDVDPDRLKMAEKFGAQKGLIFEKGTNLIQKIMDLTENRGAAVIFEAVGITQTVGLGMDCVRKGGQMTLIGNITPKVELSLQVIVTRQLRIQGSCAIAGEYPDVLTMISQGSINVDEVISQKAPLSEGASWFKRLYEKEPRLLKVILNP